MSTLSDLNIIEAKNSGDIIIEPFNEKNLRNSSYDVRLGESFYRFSTNNNVNIYNPYNQDHVNKCWKLGGYIYYSIKDNTNMLSSLDDIKNPEDYKKGIILQPYEMILGHTIEFIGGVNNITTKMQARSSYGRSGVSVCKCAGLGDVNYINRWTMEIQNSLPIPIMLTIGERIAQISFMKTGETNKNYNIKGSYQSSNDINILKETWKPEMMLPKLKYD